MTHKFATTQIGVQSDTENPILYKLTFNSGFYYYHKGKNLKQSYDKLLYDVFRATLPRDKPLVMSDDYERLIDYCKRFPQVNHVTIEVILNTTPEKILAKEKKLWNKAKHDDMCLNRSDKLPYTPEWMIRHKYIKRCEVCPKNGVIGENREKFTFCPRCGKSIKK